MTGLQVVGDTRAGGATGKTGRDVFLQSIDGIAYGGPEPLFTDYKGLQNVMIEMVQSVVTGTAEPQAALTTAASSSRSPWLKAPPPRCQA